ncbi:hypothetical protein [Bacillus sp. KH172YL63]|uniref:hypothetical protein n=1 Tax=Bacillus sp. KH172YL63 TaxID=2709784 RepID=UPI0013E45AF1|nr:hypothetical protein [Bacillus sp. KH172YL63]BCB03957.1 hypothetical protein KH172YL63_20900 [Bacillus sp. KH172YL63]
MKKDDLNVLFDHIDAHEKSSVEFQTVWRKAHRSKWKTRLFQSARYNVALLLIFFIMTPLIGYYAINQHTTAGSGQSGAGPTQMFNLSGKVYNFPNQIVIKGTSNLPEGTVLVVEHVKRNGKTLISHDTFKTDKEGTFQYTTDRLERDQEYILDVKLYPHKQSPQVKKVLGKRGEHLNTFTEKDIGFHYEVDGKQYNGIRMLGLVNKIEDTAQLVGSEFLMGYEEFISSH